MLADANNAGELGALSLLADLDVETGDPDHVVELRQPISRIRASRPRYDDGLTVRNYATALMESGHLDEAESAFRASLPLVRRAYGSAAFVLHDAAGRLHAGDKSMTRPDCPRMRKAYTPPWEGNPALSRSGIKNAYVHCFSPSVRPKRLSSWATKVAH